MDGCSFIIIIVIYFYLVDEFFHLCISVVSIIEVEILR